MTIFPDHPHAAAMRHLGAADERMARLTVPALAALTALCLAPPALAAPLFKDATKNLGSPQPCFDPNNPDAEGCYTHYVLMVDLDGDGALDLVFAGGGGYYVPDVTAPFIVYLNDGTGHFTYVNATVFGGFAGRVRQIAIGDVNGDGRPDIYVPQGYGKQADGIQDAFFINYGGHPPVFVDESATRLPITSRAGAVRFGDVDGDGDLDLVITDWGDNPPMSAGTAHLYLNDGIGHFTEKLGAIPQDTQNIGTGPIDLDFADVDGDWSLDLVVASRVGNSLLFLNDGTGTFTHAPLPKQPGPYVYGPDECDVDGDGDLDIWLDNGGAGHTEQLLINDGHGKFTDETAQRVTGNPSAGDNKVQCVDIDGDGDFDAVIASLSDHERILLNDGTGHFTLQPDAFPPILDSTLGLDVGDVDGDHILDVITAQGESGPFLNRLYLGIAPQPADTRPPGFRAVETLKDGVLPGKVRVRFAVTDSATTDTGPRLKQAYLELTGASKLPARFMGGDLFRAELDVTAGETITYRACAVDVAGNTGCSPFVTFTAAGNPGTGGASSAGSGATSSSGASGSGGAGGSGGASGSGSSGASGGSGGSGGAGGGGSAGGCGCAVPGSDGSGAAGGALGVVGLALAALSRSRRRARGPVKKR